MAGNSPNSGRSIRSTANPPGWRTGCMALRSTKRGKYYERTREASAARGFPAIDAIDASTALHEYVHHAQRMAPDLDGLFVAVHRRRTAGEPVAPVLERDPPDWTEVGRRDKYVHWYQGKEYGARPGRGDDPPVSGAAREVITMAYQMPLYPARKGEMLRELLRRDPEMVDLALGALFRYDP